MASFSFDVSVEDMNLLEQVRSDGFTIYLSLAPNDGGIDITKDGEGIQWLFISEIDASDGRTFEDHQEAIAHVLAGMPDDDDGYDGDDDD